MSPSRPPLYLLAVGALLLGLSAYLSVVAAAGSGDREATDEVLDASGAQIETPADEPIDMAAADAAADAAAPRITIRTTARARIIEPRGEPTDLGRSLPCAVTSGGRSLPEVRASLVAGPGAAIPSAAMGRHLVRFGFADGVARYRVIDLRDAESPLEVELGGMLEVRGRVTATGGGAIEGARVWIGTADGAGERRVVVTDGDGRFSILEQFAHGGAGLPIVVEAAGFASRYRVLDPAAPGIDVELALEPARSLEVQFVAAVADASLGTVVLAPESSDIALRHYPFFLAAIDATPRALSDAGRWTIGDLPTSGVIVVHVEHPHVSSVRGAEVDLSRPTAPDAVAFARVPAAVPDATFAARVVDATGAPIVGAQVVLRRGTHAAAVRGRGWLLPATSHIAGAKLAISGESGHFAIARPTDADAILSVSARGHCGVELRLPRRGAELPTVIELPPAYVGQSLDPQIALRLPERGRRFMVRVDDGNWRVWHDRDAFEIPLDEAALVDLTLELDRRDGREPLRRRFDDQLVIGHVALDLEWNH